MVKIIFVSKESHLTCVDKKLRIVSSFSEKTLSFLIPFIFENKIWKRDSRRFKVQGGKVASLPSCFIYRYRGTAGTSGSSSSKIARADLVCGLRSVLLLGIRPNLNNRSLLTKSAGVCLRWAQPVSDCCYCDRFTSVGKFTARAEAPGPRLDCKK